MAKRVFKKDYEQKCYNMCSDFSGKDKGCLYMDGALRRQKIRNTKLFIQIPIKALANEKCDELIELYGKNMVGIETGDIKRRENAPILVCTQEIYTLKYAYKKTPHKVILDEFHYIFSDTQRSRAYIEGIKKAKNTHQILIMSATLSNPEKIKQYLEKTTGKKFVLYETDFRPTRLTYTDRVFDLNTIPPFSLVYIFNTSAIDRIARWLSAQRAPLPLLKRRKIKQLASLFKINLEKFPEIFHGVARYHSRLTYTEKRFIERLVKDGYISVILATSALGVGVNLPFQWVLFGSTHIPNGNQRIRSLSKIDFVQLSGRAGRKGYYEEGFVGFLLQDFIRYESTDVAKMNYEKLLTKPLEEPEIKLEIDIWSIIKEETTLENEIEYVTNFSLPSRDRIEVEREASFIQSILASADEDEKSL